MSIGTGVFLSSFFIGTIILFLFTRDRWNWKKIVSLSALLIGLASLVVLGIYISSIIAKRPHLETSFVGIPLTATQGDIKFLKGLPRKTDNDFWIYESTENLIYITFKDNKIRYILCEAKSYLGCPSIQGIYNNESYESIVERFGIPSSLSISEDEFKRLVSYNKYNIFFELRENKVVFYGIYNPDLAPLKYKKAKVETK